MSILITEELLDSMPPELRSKIYGDYEWIGRRIIQSPFDNGETMSIWECEETDLCFFWVNPHEPEASQEFTEWLKREYPELLI